MGKTTGKELLEVAMRDIGYREGANKSNKFGEWYGMNNVAWCMEAVQYWYAQAGAPLPYKTASCGELLRWYRQNQPECVVKEPVPGCIVIFNFPGTAYSTDHTGLFVRIEDGHIITIDGNTSNGSDANGGWVQPRARPLSYANPVYIVPRELKTQNEEEKKDEEVMVRYNTMAEIAAEAPWAVATIEKLVCGGGIRGSGAPLDKDGNPTDMDLSRDMLRVFVMNDRMGVYG